MLKDEDIIPIARKWASRFLHQAKRLGSREEAFDELFNYAYCLVKPMEKLQGASTWIMWRLARFVDQMNKGCQDKREREIRAEPSPDRIAEQKEEQELLIKALRSLQTEELLVVSLYYMKDKSCREVAEILGYSKQWVSMIKKRALIRLREIMEKSERRKIKR